jgi:hypothetical protein
LSVSYNPTDVAVAKNGSVLVSDAAGGVAIYLPGVTSMEARLTNTALVVVNGVTVDANNNVYAAGTNGYVSTVVKYANMRGSGKNLGLTGLQVPAGVLLDKQRDLVVSDILKNQIKIYPPGQTSPSSTISVDKPDLIAFNTEQSEIYVPQNSDQLVGIFAYPGGSRLKLISFGGYAVGAAFYPAPNL